jgi:tRNA(Ile)-lysidine synthase
MRRLEPVVRRALRAVRTLGRGDTLLVAVSGGADSTALLVTLHGLSHEHGVSLHAAHLHHGLRGRDADLDREHVRGLCAGLGVPLSEARIAARARLRARGLSGEAGLRTLRREWLARAARRVGARAIATAHTADDQLETLLLRLARGAGLVGLGGMRPCHGRWIKPLLAATRHDVEHDLRAAGIAWREDATNRDVAIARNRVRHEAVPALLAALHGEHATLAQRASLARRAAAAAAELRAARRAIRPAVRAALERARACASGGWGLDARAVAGRPLAVRIAHVEALWRRTRPDARALPRVVRDALARALAGGRGGRRWALPGGAWAERAGAEFRVHPPGPDAPRRRRPAVRARGSGGGGAGAARDAILPARKRRRSQAAMDGSQRSRDPGPVAPPTSARRSKSGHEPPP